MPTAHGSLAYHKARGYTLTIFCEEPGARGDIPCRHSACADWDVLIAKFGPDFVIPDRYAEFIRGLRCGKCGGKRLSLILHQPEAARQGDGKAHVW